MSFTPATLIAEPTYRTLHFDGSRAHSDAVAKVLADLLEGGHLNYGYMQGSRELSNPPFWFMVASPTLRPEEIRAYPGTWIVVSSTGVLRVMNDTEYFAEFKPNEPEV